MENEISKLLEQVEKESDFINLIESNFLKFSSEQNFGIPEEIFIKEATKYFKYNKYLPDSKGLLIARKAISDFYNEQNIISNPNDIIITASTSESYSMIFNSFTNIDDEILLPNPTYPLFEYLSDYSHLKPIFYKLDRENNWAINFKNLESKISKKTKGIVLISPNNPCGSILSANELSLILKIAKENNLFIIFDEVFSEFNNLKSLPRPELIDNVNIFILNGISKLLARPDLKLAWIKIISNNKVEIIDKLETANDTYLNANYFIQYILPTLLKWSSKIRQDINSIININKITLNEVLKNKNSILKCNIGNGGIHSIISVKSEKSEEEIVLGLLKDYHLSIHPGYFYDFDNKEGNKNFIISFLNNPEKFKDGIRRFLSYIA